MALARKIQYRKEVLLSIVAQVGYCLLALLATIKWSYQPLACLLESLAFQLLDGLQPGRYTSRVRNMLGELAFVYDKVCKVFLWLHLWTLISVKIGVLTPQLLWYYYYHGTSVATRGVTVVLLASLHYPPPPLHSHGRSAVSCPMLC